MLIGLIMFMSLAMAQEQIFLSRPIHGRPNIVVKTIKDNSTFYPVPYITQVYDERDPHHIVLTRLAHNQQIAQLQHEVSVQWSYAYYAEANNDTCGCEEADEEFRVYYLEHQVNE